MVLMTSVEVHWNGCIWFFTSEIIGFGSDKWVYPNMTNGFGVNITKLKVGTSLCVSVLIDCMCNLTPHKVVKYQLSYSVNIFTRCTGQHLL